MNFKELNVLSLCLGLDHYCDQKFSGLNSEVKFCSNNCPNMYITSYLKFNIYSNQNCKRAMLPEYKTLNRHNVLCIFRRIKCCLKGVDNCLLVTLKNLLKQSGCLKIKFIKIWLKSFSFSVWWKSYNLPLPNMMLKENTEHLNCSKHGSVQNICHHFDAQSDYILLN